MLQALLRETFSKLHQVKANFSPVRLSAMEDFIGRGDRRIAKVRGLRVSFLHYLVFFRSQADGLRVCVGLPN